MPQSNGPYLTYAAVCEKVLRETDDVISLIRIVDRVNVTIPLPAQLGTEVPADLVAAAPPIAVTFVLGLKSGGYVGSLPIKIRIETPSEADWPDFATSLNLEGEDRGASLVLPMQFPALVDGLYWFVVEVGGEVMTRVPLRVTKQVVPQDFPSPT
jgi:hypothetical protein